MANPVDLSVWDPCPSADQLREFSVGKLQGPDLEAMAAHLHQCERCTLVLDGMSTHLDSLAQAVRDCADAPPRLDAAGPLDVGVLAAGLPRELGPYLLLEMIGRGGMGTVFKARQRRPERIVAVKIASALQLGWPESLLRFRTEVEAIGRLDHPGIVRVFDYGEQDGEAFFSMEFMEGGTLAHRLAEGPMAQEEAAKLVASLATAVHSAHQADVVHRDLKPSNVLLGKQGEAKIGDFGLAKFFAQSRAGLDLTASHAILGTAAYMAPELAAGGARDADRSVDVYGLGAVLYEALTGRPPFDGPDREAILQQVLRRSPAEPRTIRPSLSPKLEAICMACLRKSPRDRYASAAALADDLTAFLKGRPQWAKPPGLTRRAYRLARRRALGATLASLVPAAVYAKRTLDPDRPMRLMQSQLADGKTVVLIGEKGEPKWRRYCAGESRTQTSLASDGAFAVHSWSTCLLELLPEVPLEEFEISAEVCHHRSDLGGEVGIYFARTAEDAASDFMQSFVQLSYNDLRNIADVLPQFSRSAQMPDRRRNRAWLCTRIYSDRDGAEIVSQFHPVAFGPPYRYSVNGGVWRRLVVRITPKTVHSRWNNVELEAVSTESIRQTLIEGRRIHTRAGPQIISQRAPAAPSGGIGLFVSRGSATFRSFAVST